MTLINLAHQNNATGSIMYYIHWNDSFVDKLVAV